MVSQHAMGQPPPPDGEPPRMENHPPPQMETPPDGHCAGGTHPTGMHSCDNKIYEFLKKKIVENFEQNNTFHRLTFHCIFCCCFYWYESL